MGFEPLLLGKAFLHLPTVVKVVTVACEDPVAHEPEFFNERVIFDERAKR